MSTTAEMIRSIEPEDSEVPARREHPAATRAGWIEVIAGSMFSGKSEELIRRLRRARIARQKVQVFKPEMDARFSNDHIVSHSEMRHESSNVRTAAEIRASVEYITKTHAICMKCGQPANYTQRTFESEERVAVGGAGMYEARCRSCFVPHADAPSD